MARPVRATMKEDIHALPSGRGTNVLRGAGNEGEDPSPVAKGEAVMGVMLME